MATGLELGCKRSLAAALPQLGVPFGVTSPSASWPRPPQPPTPAAVERWHSQVPGSLFPPTQDTDPGEGQAGPDGVGLVSVSALPRSGSNTSLSTPAGPQTVSKGQCAFPLACMPSKYFIQLLWLYLQLPHFPLWGRPQPSELSGRQDLGTTGGTFQRPLVTSYPDVKNSHTG